MSYSVKTIPQFDKQIKRLVKKYPSFKSDFVALVVTLRENPFHGTPIGKSCYKIRVAIRSKRKGKSAGARVIAHIVVTEGTVYLLSIYDKSEKESISTTELNELLKFIP